LIGLPFRMCNIFFKVCYELHNLNVLSKFGIIDYENVLKKRKDVTNDKLVKKNNEIQLNNQPFPPMHIHCIINDLKN